MKTIDDEWRMRQAKAAIAAMRDLVKCCPDGNMVDDRMVNEYIDAALKEE